MKLYNWFVSVEKELPNGTVDYQPYFFDEDQKAVALAKLATAAQGPNIIKATFAKVRVDH
jgi:hypothetical protein